MSYIGQRPVVGRYIKLDQISSGFNGSNTGFNMTAGSQAVFPGTARNLLLSLGGVIQEPDTDFTISGSTLTFTTPPVANTTFFGVIYGDMQATGTPSDGTVLPASIASSGNFSFPEVTVTGDLNAAGDIVHIGDTNTKIRFSDTDQIKLETAGAQRLKIDGTEVVFNDDGASVDFRVEGDTEANLLFVDASADKVGIGTNAPATALDLRGDLTITSTAPFINFIDTDNDDDFNIQVSGGQFAINNTNDAVTNLVINSSGNVGIGTSSPDALFHVESGGATSTRLSGNRGDSNNLPIANIEFENTFNTQGVVAEIKAITGSSGTQSSRGQLTFSTDNGSALSERVRIDGSGNMQVSTGQFTVGTTATTGLQFINDGTFGTLHSADLTFRTGSSTQMTIDTSGNVGIGTTDPSQLLSLSSSDPRIVMTETTNNSNCILDYAAGGILEISVDDNGKDTGSKFQVRIDGATASLTLDSTGLGIGTTSPTAKLDVRGDASSNFQALRLVNTQHDTNAQGGAQLKFGITNSLGERNCRIEAKEEANNINDVALDFYTNSANSTDGEAIAMRIKGNGNIGIGTTTAGANLEIEGNVSSTTQFSGYQGLRIQNANGATHGITADINMVVGTASSNRGAVIGVEYTSTASGNDLYFATNPGAVTNSDAVEERMRITSSGDLLVGTLSSAIAVATNDDTGVNLSPAGRIFVKTNDHCDFNVVGGGEIIRFRFGTTDGSTQSHAGDIDVTGTNTVVYGSSSDYRLKENVVPISDGISRLKTLKPYRFNFLSEPSKTLDGFFAHEAQEVVPEAVVGIKDDPDRMQGIDQAKLVPLLVAALQEEISKREALEARVAALEAA